MPDIRFDRPAMARASVLVGVATWITVLARVRVRDMTAWTIDDSVVRVLLVAVGFAILFVLGVKQLRKRHIRSSLAFAGLGVVSCLPPFLAANGWSYLTDSASNGIMSLMILLPTLIGGASGFLYHRSAGYETDCDDVDALAAKVSQGEIDQATGVIGPDPSGAQANAFGRRAGPPAYVATETAEYYSGPLQVSDSPGARWLAAFSGAALHVFLQTMGALGDNFHIPIRKEWDNPALIVGLGVVGGTVLNAAFIKLVASILRKFDKTSLLSFAFAGLVTPWIFGLPLGPAGWFMALGVFIPFGFAMTVFHILAGFEPKSLPDDIVVKDRRALVGADHARRRMARVIDTNK